MVKYFLKLVHAVFCESQNAAVTRSTLDAVVSASRPVVRPPRVVLAVLAALARQVTSRSHPRAVV